MPVRIFAPLAGLSLAAACAEPADQAVPQGEADNVSVEAGKSVEQPQPASEAPAPTPRAAQGWQADSRGALRLNDAEGEALLRLACLAGPPRLVVTAPAFSPIGSEDRFSFGIGNEPITLVADPTRQAQGQGVAGEGPVPANLRELFASNGKITALYGTQSVGPVDPPERELLEAFTAACDDVAS